MARTTRRRDGTILALPPRGERDFGLKELTAHSYDGHDRKLKTQFPSPTAINTASTTDYEQYGWDANANLTSLRKRSGQSITLAYDNLNRLTARSYPTTADNVAYTYDLLGRRLAATGATSVTHVPCPGAAAISIPPPNSFIRCSIRRRPWPPFPGASGAKP